MPTDTAIPQQFFTADGFAARFADRTRAVLLRMNARPGPCLALLALLLAIQVGPWWYPTPDSVSYLSMARSFASGEGMTNLGREQLYYSPGYSLLISPTFYFGDRPFLAISLLQFVVATLAVAGVYLWARRQTTNGALLATALVFVNALVLLHYRRALTEIPFLCATIWTALAMQWTLTAKTPRRALARALPAAGSLLVACLLRQAGVTLVAGFGVALLYEVYTRRIHLSRAAALLATVATPAVVALWIVVHKDLNVSMGEETYLDGFVVADSSLLAQIVECVRLRVCDIGRILVPGMSKAHPPAGSWLNLDVPIYLAVTAIVAVGWWRLVRTRRDVLAMAFPFYLGLYAVWPFESGGRFLVPLVPLLAVCLWFALESYARHRLNVVAWLVALHLVVAVGYWGAVELPRISDFRERWASIEALAAEIDTQRDSVAAMKLPLETRLMLELALDRPVVERASLDGLDTNVAWIVEPAFESPDSEFTLQRTVEPLQLLARSKQDSATDRLRIARGTRERPPVRTATLPTIRR